MKLYYKGLLRVLLVLLHDWTDFLSEFVYIFVQEIPPRLIQVRNIILASFPKCMQPSDPFQVTHLDSIPEFKEMPSFYYPDLDQKITQMNLFNDLNKFLSGNKEEGLRSICNTLVQMDAADIDNNPQVMTVFTLSVPYLLYNKFNQT